MIKTENGTNIAIDCGSAFDDIGQYTMVPALLSQGMGHIDYWCISHFDKDHISGFLYVLQEGDKLGIDIENIVVANNGIINMKDNSVRQIFDLAKVGGSNILYMESGDYMAGDDFKLECLHPHRGYCGEEKNDTSLVLLYESENLEVLFTGDIGMDVEENLPLQEKKIDVIKIPHHGSKYSTSDSMLNVTEPDWAVISCGRDNSYGHPHEDVLKRLDRVGSGILRTDLMGAIYIYGR